MYVKACPTHIELWWCCTGTFTHRTFWRKRHKPFQQAPRKRTALPPWSLHWPQWIACGVYEQTSDPRPGSLLACPESQQAKQTKLSFLTPVNVDTKLLADCNCHVKVLLLLKRVFKKRELQTPREDRLSAESQGNKNEEREYLIYFISHKHFDYFVFSCECL